MLAARTTRRHEKRNRHWRGKESAAESRTCQRMDTITCLLSDQSNAMCIIGELPAMPASLFVCMKKRRVSWRHSSSFAQGLCSIWASDCSTFLGTAPSCGLPWCTREAVSEQDQQSKCPRPGQEYFMFDCTATACHPNLKPGSTIVALLCGVQERCPDLVELGKAYYA